VVMYVFAIIFTSQFGKPPIASAGDDAAGSEEAEDTAADIFSDLGTSMMTLFTNGVLGDNLAGALEVIKTDSLAMMWLFILFMVISGMTLLNMLIGVLCQVIEESSHEESEQNQVNILKASFEEAFRCIDTSNDGVISEEEWKKMKHNPSVRQSLATVGVDEKDMDMRLDQMQETFFGASDNESERKTGITYNEFVEKVAGLRWDIPASTLDLEMLKELVRHEDKLLKKKLGSIEAILMKRPVSANQTPMTLALQEEDHHGRPAAGPALAAGGAGSSEAPPMWLREVPTELLLHVLQTRASSQ